MDLGIGTYKYEEEDLIHKRNEMDLYPVTREAAKKIASKSKNLRRDYSQMTNNTIGILFDRMEVRAVSKKGRAYWQVQVLSATTYDCVEPDEEDMNFFQKLIYRHSPGDFMEHLDGEIYEKEDLDLLRCLIDMQTGEYIYYPKRKF